MLTTTFGKDSVCNIQYEHFFRYRHCPQGGARGFCIRTPLIPFFNINGLGIKMTDACSNFYANDRQYNV